MLQTLVEQLQAQVQKDDLQLEAMKAELSGTPARSPDAPTAPSAQLETPQQQQLAVVPKDARVRERYRGVSIQRTAKYRWLDDPALRACQAVTCLYCVSPQLAHFFSLSYCLSQLGPLTSVFT